MKKQLRTDKIWVVAFIMFFILISYQLGLCNQASPLISKVFVKYDNGVLKCNILSNKSVQYKVTNMNDPRKSLIFDIYPAQLDVSAKKEIDINNGNFEKIRIKQFSDNPDIVRVVVDIKDSVKYSVKMGENNKGLTLALGDNLTVSAKDATAEIEIKDSQGLAKEEIIVNKTENNSTIVSLIEPVVKVSEKVTKNNVKTVAQNQPVIKVAPPEKKKTTYKKPSKKKTYSKPEPKYLMDYDNADLLFLLNELSKKSGANIVISNNVKGNVTVHFKGITLEKALKYILNTTGFTFKKISNIYIVGNSADLSKITPQTMIGGGSEEVDVVNLNYAKADEISKTIQSSIPNITTMTDARLNAIVLRGTKSSIKEALSLAKQLDIPPQAVAPGSITKVLRVKYADRASIKAQIDKWFPGLSIVEDTRLNALVLTADEATVNEVEKYMAKVDIAEKQVMIDVKVVNINETGAKNLGFVNSWIPIATQLTEAATPPNGAPPTYLDLPIQAFVRSPIRINVTLQALITEGKAKIVACPKIATLNGKEATLTVGQRYPIAYQDPRAGDWQAIYIDIAVKLKVTPTITPDGYVEAKITPEISDMATSSSGSQYPETITRKADSTIRCKDGDTIILAGLFRKDKTNNKSRIPLLGDVPIFGEIFRNTNATTSKDELVIMITPKIMELGDQVEDVTNKAEVQINEGGVK